LTVVDLSYNQITTLPKNLLDENFKLTHLSLRGNQIREFPSSWYFLSNKSELTCVSLSDNKIQKIPNGLFMTNHKLSILNLNGNQIETIEDDFLEYNPELCHLGLANNQIKNNKKAATFLENGLDFVIDDQALEINFNIQLGEAYSALGDIKKKEKYFSKAEDLIKKQKK
jgi:Leucine-rich repeat (LRR) protein